MSQTTNPTLVDLDAAQLQQRLSFLELYIDALRGLRASAAVLQVAEGVAAETRAELERRAPAPVAPHPRSAAG